jgi:hypothetical protein
MKSHDLVGIWYHKVRLGYSLLFVSLLSKEKLETWGLTSLCVTTKRLLRIDILLTGTVEREAIRLNIILLKKIISFFYLMML